MFAEPLLWSLYCLQQNLQASEYLPGNCAPAFHFTVIRNNFLLKFGTLLNYFTSKWLFVCPVVGLPFESAGKHPDWFQPLSVLGPDSLCVFICTQGSSYLVINLVQLSNVLSFFVWVIDISTG